MERVFERRCPVCKRKKKFTEIDMETSGIYGGGAHIHRLWPTIASCESCGVVIEIKEKD